MVDKNTFTSAAISSNRRPKNAHFIDWKAEIPSRMNNEKRFLPSVKNYTFGPVLFAVIFFAAHVARAQVSPCDCSASPGSGDINFSTITWTGTGCPTAGSTSYSGNLCLTLSNGTNIIMDKNFTVNGRTGPPVGGLGISNGGNSTFTVPSGFTLNVVGNMGDDANNNVTFTVNGALNVSGTIYGKNSNAFSGSGSITAGGLDFNQPPTCSPCDIDWTVGTCLPASPFCTIVLPITLISFNVQEQTDFVRLTWATASELNFDRFFIERSLDGKEFSEIGSMKGAGTSVSRRDYAFDDKAPIVGRSYYRLKAVDYDGFTEYFEVDVCNYVGPKSIVIYPNPSQGEPINLILNFHPEEQSQIEIFNSIGVKLDQIFVSELTNDVKLPPGLKAGSYLIRFTSGSYSQVVRFSVF